MNLKKEILTALKVFLGFTLILGVAYPLLITTIAQLAMPHKANGSILEQNGKIIGSTLIGQNFDKPEYFNSRPSSVDYNAQASGGSNLAPTSQKLANRVSFDVKKIQKENNLQKNNSVPADAVLTSASGLDPHISIENALLQLPRVAKERKLSELKIKKLINKNTDSDFIGIWGQSGVNVLKLNTELDKVSGK